MKKIYRYSFTTLILSTVTMQCAHALECFEDPITAATQCIDEKNVREKSGIRSAPLYAGGPNGVRNTSYTIHTNCNTGVTHLKDKDGVSFGGGQGNETAKLRALRSWVCQAKVRK